ncbi:MAG: hypothetical protein VSS75_006730 [Candidatus Parabeggiatoa sp.]|nr:hypothetical protein [Candidatus Parabeggiatoa sp.]
MDGFRYIETHLVVTGKLEQRIAGGWYEIIPWFRSDDYMMDNIKQWENPWMKELGETIPRIRYSPVTELCSCEM